jgi:hypothetical protein
MTFALEHPVPDDIYMNFTTIVNNSIASDAHLV